MTSFYAHVARQQGLIPAGETIRWSGAPRGGLLFRKSDALALPVSFLFTAFTIVWESAAVRTGVLFAILWGIPFVAAALYGLIGRFAWDAYRREHTRYTVTDRAAYIVTGGVGGGVQRFAGPGLYDIRLERNADGSGTMRFGPEPPARYTGRSWTRPQRSGFEAVRDLDAAYAAVLAAQRG